MNIPPLKALPVSDFDFSDEILPNNEVVRHHQGVHSKAKKVSYP
jgi:hypothetical protein